MTRTAWLPARLSIPLWLATPGMTRAQGVADQVRAWFLEEYAPLWHDMDAADPGRLTAFWAQDFRDHPIDMDSSIWENSRETWQRNIDRNRAEGLAGSTVVWIQVEEISARAVLIRTAWLDHGEDGPMEEPYCGTFIAGLFGEEWRFTNYFTAECPDP